MTWPLIGRGSLADARADHPGVTIPEGRRCRKGEGGASGDEEVLTKTHPCKARPRTTDAAPTHFIPATNIERIHMSSQLLSTGCVCLQRLLQVVFEGLGAADNARDGRK